MAGSKERKPVTTSTNLRLLFPESSIGDVERCLKKLPRAPYSNFGFVLGEANIEHHNQFCADKDISPGKWIRVVGPSSWDVHQVLTRAQDELHVDPDAVTAVDVAGSAPIRTMAFDLETFCTDLGNGATKFYDGDHAQARILCISAVVFDYCNKEIEGRVFSVGNTRGSELQPTTDGTAQCRIDWYLEERAMNEAFLQYIIEYDPDIITGWNTLGSVKAFDWMFLYKRCKTLGLQGALAATSRWGGTKFFIDNDTGQWVERARIPIVMPGRIMHDMMVWVKKNKNLREYNLNFVAESFGCGEKDDVSYNQIDSLSRTHEGRTKLAIYCELDSRLVCKLMLAKSLDPIGKSVALSAITGCPIEDLIFKGSMNSLRLCLLRVSHKHNFVLSCPSYAEPDPEPLEVGVVDEREPTSRYQVRTAPLPVPPRHTDDLAYFRAARYWRPWLGFTRTRWSRWTSAVCTRPACASRTSAKARRSQEPTRSPTAWRSHSHRRRRCPAYGCATAPEWRGWRKPRTPTSACTSTMNGGTWSRATLTS
jgi:DNA polymerase elongation subunit (family B)